MVRAIRLTGVILAAAVLAAGGQAGVPDSFAGRIAALSEAGGSFDTDNLISNERSYLHVVPALEQARTSGGGAYIGVGPDQNFSYIAHVRPAVAVIVDIRRDNLLLHLLFKAIFAISPTRVEYLSHLTGRAPPPRPADWSAASIDRLVARIDQAGVADEASRRALRARLSAALDRTGVPLSATDRATIEDFHARFVAAGLSLQFHSTGRPPRWDYPTYRDLLLETDRAGVRRSFLASEADFQFVRRLHSADLIVPVVGDLAGGHALRAVGAWLVARRQPVAAFYTSNVEFYLFRQGAFGRFAANLSALPFSDSAVVIRSAFGGSAPVAPGYNSASLTQGARALVDGAAAGRFRRYGDLLAASR